MDDLDLDDFTRGYLDAALWTEDHNPGPGDSDRLHERRSLLSPEAIDKALSDCKAFIETQHHALHELSDAGVEFHTLGHDLWLTRNGHGTGYWDRDYGEAGEDLSDASRAIGESYLYTGDDGRLYLS